MVTRVNGGLGRALLKVLTRLRNPLVVDEHFVPGMGLDLEPYLRAGNTTGAHHLLRYEWACSVLRDLRPVGSVLDIACGAGYGSYLMAKRLPETRVVGVDYDPAAVRRALREYALPNLEYRVGDCTRLDETVGGDPFDCVVSFDTIEHVAHREVMMEGLVNHLRPGGRLLLSTPCGRAQNLLHPRWGHHRLEYSAASLYDFLRRYFRTVQRPEDGTLPHLDVFDRLRGTGIQYTLRLNPVICSDPIVIPNPYR